MIVIPKPGLQIADPDQHDYLPSEGRVVPPTEYWLRRLLDEDVTLADPDYSPVRPVFQPTVRGTTAQRPDPAEQGDTRFNTDLDSLEVYLGSDGGWQVLAGLGEDVIAGVLSARQDALDAKSAAQAAAAAATAVGNAVAAAVQEATAPLSELIQNLQTQISALQAGSGSPGTPSPPVATSLPYIT
ncbi:DUF2635 domain-containing protein [Muricoccus aerilatus]|uniref:DUF2635 domain-containing protein n=1 Tax=Muricoccus aerilatus TaxID=452982 RepID=UPI0005C22D69|nr:DUF2635 domain-containing protein [Roseomonas aerilata]